MRRILFARPGNPYVTRMARIGPTNGVRFAALSRMAAEIGWGATPSFVFRRRESERLRRHAKRIEHVVRNCLVSEIGEPSSRLRPGRWA